ncbi:MAG: hypothetical protein R2857_06965 [Vampirovibrionales bacterium]
MMFDGDFDDAPSPEPWSTTGLIIIGIQPADWGRNGGQNMLTTKTAEPDQTDAPKPIPPNRYPPNRGL